MAEISDILKIGMKADGYGKGSKKNEKLIPSG